MTKKKSPLAILTIIVILLIALSIYKPGITTFLVLLVALLGASAILLLHLLIFWRRLAVTMRLSMVLSILAWIGLFYGLIHANGLNLTGFFVN